jgi:hypothetical protein
MDVYLPKTMVMYLERMRSYDTEGESDVMFTIVIFTNARTYGYIHVFCAPSQTDHAVHSTSQILGTGLFPGCKAVEAWH